MDPAPAASAESAPPLTRAATDVIEVQAPDKLPHADLHGAVPAVDRFAREAAQQYAEGHIDQPLWDRAVAQHKGDSDAVEAAYLKARATALRLLDRELRQEHRPAARAPVKHAVTPPPADGDATGTLDDDGIDAGGGVQSADFARKRLLGKYRTALIAGGIAVPVLIVGAWLMLGRSDPPPVAAPARPAVVAAAKPASAPVKAATPAAQPVNAEFMLKLQQFRDAGNWNMVVLYAVEWTRREPANAAAWNELRAGYVNLRQFEDALAAARKAVDLAPTDAMLRRHLGDAELDVDDPAKALAAFTDAAARDPADLYSLQQIGLLNARAGRMPEAKSAFDLALVAQAGDPLTLCLKSGVAQLPVQKDAHAAALQVRTLDAKCRGTDIAAEPAAPVAATQRAGATPGGKRATPRS